MTMSIDSRNLSFQVFPGEEEAEHSSVGKRIMSHQRLYLALELFNLQQNLIEYQLAFVIQQNLQKAISFYTQHICTLKYSVDVLDVMLRFRRIFPLATITKSLLCFLTK